MVGKNIVRWEYARQLLKVLGHHIVVDQRVYGGNTHIVMRVLQHRLRFKNDLAQRFETCVCVEMESMVSTVYHGYTATAMPLCADMFFGCFWIFDGWLEPLD